MKRLVLTLILLSLLQSPQTVAQGFEPSISASVITEETSKKETEGHFLYLLKDPVITNSEISNAGKAFWFIFNDVWRATTSYAPIYASNHHWMSYANFAVMVFGAIWIDVYYSTKAHLFVKNRWKLRKNLSSIRNFPTLKKAIVFFSRETKEQGYVFAHSEKMTSTVFLETTSPIESEQWRALSAENGLGELVNIPDPSQWTVDLKLNLDGEIHESIRRVTLEDLLEGQIPGRPRFQKWIDAFKEFEGGENIISRLLLKRKSRDARVEAVLKSPTGETYKMGSILHGQDLKKSIIPSAKEYALALLTGKKPGTARVNFRSKPMKPFSLGAYCHTAIKGARALVPSAY